VLLDSENNAKRETTMNAGYVKAAWNWFPPRRKRPKPRQSGFALDAGVRRHGLPLPHAEARERFECAARQALREWLML
jgi:hypothetical protein